MSFSELPLAFQNEFFDSLAKFAKAFEKIAEKGLIAVECPKCNGKMVPLSSIAMRGNFSKGASYAVVPLARWVCIKCGHTIKYQNDY